MVVSNRETEKTGHVNKFLLCWIVSKVNTTAHGYASEQGSGREEVISKSVF